MGFEVYSKANATHHMEMYLKMWFNSLLDLYELFENSIWHMMNHDCIQLIFPFQLFCPTFPPPNCFIVDSPPPPSIPPPSLCPFNATYVYMYVGQSTSTCVPQQWQHLKGSCLFLSYPYQLSPAESSLVRSGV